MEKQSENIIHELSTVRIKKVIINNFKSVKHGEITLSCGRRFVEAGTKSDILGLYGQNGSGKSALIEALKIMQLAITGRRIYKECADFINIETNQSDFEFYFDMQWPDGLAVEAMYKFGITKKEIAKDEEDEDKIDDSEELANPYRRVFDNSIVILNNEILSFKIVSPVQLKENKKVIFDTSTKNSAFRYTPSLKNILDENVWKNMLPDLEVQKRIATKESRSAIFSSIKLLKGRCNKEALEFKILDELRLYCSYYLTVIGTQSYGVVQLGGLLLFVGEGEYSIPINSSGVALPKDALPSFEKEINSLNKVISTIIPGTGIYVKELGPRLFKNKEGLQVALMCTHQKEDKSIIEIPVHYESDGIKRMISFLLALIKAFDQKSFTIVVDELDSGIFEYLLGELLQAFEESGRGQFIFTSHNLRPLEVINKDFLYFTTTNPDNRYVQMKKVHTTNNLRSMYFREILTNSTQDEEIYSGTKRYKIVDAIRHAGEVE